MVMNCIFNVKFWLEIDVIGKQTVKTVHKQKTHNIVI